MIRRAAIAAMTATSAGALLFAVLLLARLGIRAWLVAFMSCLVGVALLMAVVRTLRPPIASGAPPAPASERGDSGVPEA